MKYHTKKLPGFLVVMMFLVPVCLRAQDTIHITLPEAEKQFLQNNLSLLAERYNIDMARAQVIQARLYNNPTLILNGNLYNPQRNKILDVSNKTGQYDIGLQQLIRLAGKRNKEIKLAETSVSLSENQFFDLVRTLRYSLRSEFYNLFYLQQSVNTYEQQIRSLEIMSAAYNELQAKGVVPLKDAVRIRSLLYSLQTELAGLVNQLNESESNLQLLLQNNKTYFIADSNTTAMQASSYRQLNVLSLIDTAYVNRYDLKAAETNLLLSKQNYSLQKALAKTDLTLGAEFDKRGSFVDNASFLTVTIDLPFFKRNQGNIRAARWSIKQSEAGVELAKQTVENEVRKDYVRLLNSEKMLRSIDPDFQLQFEKLMQGVTDNFRKKNISLIEFIDFQESYRNNTVQFNQLQNEMQQAAEALNFAVGKTILNN